MSEIKRTPVKQKAKQIAELLYEEEPDYDYLREIFRHLRKELNVKVIIHGKKPLYIPTEEEIQKYYNAVWQSRKMNHIVLIKILLYTGIRVSELIKVKIDDVDFDKCQIKILQPGKKERSVPFPNAFKETLGMHASVIKARGGTHLFESSWKKPYTARGIRVILAIYTERAGMQRSISPNRLRHFLFAWLKKQGIDDILIQAYSGHERAKSLELYAKLSAGGAYTEYSKVINKFPV